MNRPTYPLFDGYSINDATGKKTEITVLKDSELPIFVPCLEDTNHETEYDNSTPVMNYCPMCGRSLCGEDGRTARADRNGCAITFVNENDIYYFKQIEKFLNKDIEKLALPEGLGDGPKYEIKKGEKRNGSKSHNDKRRNSIRNSKHKAKTEEKSNKTRT